MPNIARSNVVVPNKLGSAARQELIDALYGVHCEVFDGVTRHNPEGVWFRRQAQLDGFKSAVEWRDSGRPIPEGDQARELIRDMDARRSKAEDGGDQADLPLIAEDLVDLALEVLECAVVDLDLVPLAVLGLQAARLVDLLSADPCGT